MIMQTSPRQLALSLEHAESFARDDFVVGDSNAKAIALIDRWPDWPDRVMALTGPEGSGKSHLATIWAGDAGARILSARLLGQVGAPAALSTGALVLEDLTAEQLDERSLFHLLNLAREERAAVLITARSAPSGWPVQIRDLASRLRAIPHVPMMAPDDDLLRALIVKLASDRQLEFDETLVRYLILRIERSFTAAQAAVSVLDHEAMRQKRAVTRALAAEIFGGSA
ncbi:MAG: chromosomal replication initiator DnaA [Pseudolabrys sp.]|nr:chromosomal replication initiator DnaA [Pseudolabrys sp.]